MVAITDPVAPPEPAFLEAHVDRAVLPYLQDPRDVIFPRLVFRMATRLMPLMVGMYFLPTWLVAVVALPYWIYMFVGFCGPVILSLHAVTHRPLFVPELKVLDGLVTHLLPLCVGMTPFAYRSHHVRMHHTENNSADDLSGTSAYQRDNFLHFLHYWARFTFFGYWHLSSWLFRRNKARQAWEMLIGDAVLYAGFGALFYVAPVPTAVVFVVPYCVLRFLLMAGNWTEHAFVDVTEPTNYWRNSTCLLNTRYNHRCFNSGYHLIHHRVPGLHWAETVQQFEKCYDKLVESDSIVFDGVPDNQTIFWMLMLGKYEYLADRLVDIGNRRPTREEKIAFLKQRVQLQVGDFKPMVGRVEHADKVAA